MDQDAFGKSDAGQHEPARHISMELRADSARVTNLSMEGTRLMLTIEAELFSSQVKASGTGDASGAGNATSPAAPPAAPVDDPQTPLPIETAPPQPSPPDQGAFPLPAATGEKYIEKAISEDIRNQAANLSRQLASGGAGIAPPPAPSSAGVANAKTPETTPETADKTMEAASAGLKSDTGTTSPVRTEHFHAGYDDRKTFADMRTEPAEHDVIREEMELETTAGAPTNGSVIAHATTRELTDAVPAAHNGETASPANHAAVPPVIDPEDVFAPTPELPDDKSAFPDEDPEGGDVLESLPPFPETVDAERDGMEFDERVITVNPADLDEAMILSEESSAVGGDRHGEPLPSIAFGCEEVTTPQPPPEPIFKREEAPAAPPPEIRPAVSGPMPESLPKLAAIPDMPSATTASGKPASVPRNEVPAPQTPEAGNAKSTEPPRPAAAGTTVLIRYTCPKCKTQGMQAVDKVGTVVNCSNCGKAMRLVMKK